ncbi:MAG TPA: TetR/AcrR family transcriptional regulator [Acidimicrobiales bacterium]|nr:TetR/AcrR family transcriptional regulator [Acidimicrobiales bacterium]
MTQILDAAEDLVESRGYNGFSYADVANDLGITRAALHYHFANKSDLGVALIGRYTERFTNALKAAETRTGDAPSRLQAYADLYLDVLRHERMCLCGMLAAEHETLPLSMQESVVRFFVENQTWLSRVLLQGVGDGTIEFSGSADDAARMVISCLEGAMLLARLLGDVETFQSSATHVLAGLRPRGDRPEVRVGSEVLH